jgi:hypothetical protein
LLRWTTANFRDPFAQHDPPCRAYGLAHNITSGSPSAVLVSQNKPVHEAQIGPHSRLLTTREEPIKTEFVS